METNVALPLPNDVLADVLRRLPARSLARARCVRRAWCAIVDARGLLLPHVLPVSVGGVFINYVDYCRQHLFARPSLRVDGSLGFVPRDNPGTWSPVGDHRSSVTFDGAVPVDDRGRWSAVRDHCNGLVLYDDGAEFSVVNPATRRWARLPPHERARDSIVHLVFDPAASHHYEVVLIPDVPEKPKPATGKEESPFRPWPPPPCPRAGEDEPEDPCRSMEWPPSPCTVHVFSSRTWRWEERAFVRQGDAAGTVADVLMDSPEPELFGARRRHAAYWHGALYVHCRGPYVMRLSLSQNKYQVIKMPVTAADGRPCRCYLGKSEKGVYFARIRVWYDLRVWILNESCGQMEWVLKHENDLQTTALLAVSRLSYHKQIGGRWVLEEDDSNEDENNQDGADNKDDPNQELLEEDFGWDSDEDDFIEIEEGDAKYLGGIFILGFHPSKEIMYFCSTFGGVAYHLNNSKVQCLGSLRPKHYHYTPCVGICGAFPYTPCMIGEFPDKNSRISGKHGVEK